MAPSAKTIAAILLAAGPALLSLGAFFPWAGIDATGAQGSGEDVLRIQYHVAGIERFRAPADDLGQPVAGAAYTEWNHQWTGSEGVLGQWDGLNGARWVQGLLLTGLVGSLAAIPLAMAARHRPAIGTAATAVLAAAALVALAAVVLFLITLADMTQWEQDHLDRGLLRQAADGTAVDSRAYWTTGAFLGAPGAVLLAGGAVFALMAALRPAPRTPPAGGASRFPGDDAVPPGPATPQHGTPPAQEDDPATAPYSDEDLPLPPGTDDSGRPPRHLTCPRCHHPFIGQWGVPPTCPQCGYASPRR